ncbi:EpsG family protein [Adlercreutzia sp. ZJ138]|uniref:EpsG family protein n=1 Tax=Adlercreutzia sp. ZJ138 TaxID=2709405 RepID=UPI0013ED42BB|nr:EpsG family protein [Adlercreutzia sp. ZJ138]
MLINVFNIGLMCFWYALLKPSRSDSAKRLFCIICAVQMGLIAGLRADSVGEDTSTYHHYYDVLWLLSLEDMWSPVAPLGGLYQSSPGFYLLMKLCQLCGLSWQGFVFFESMLFCLALAYFVYHCCEDPLMGFSLYTAIFFSFMPLSAMKQSLAIALTLFVGYKFARDRRYVVFLLLVAIATTMHKSALFALPLGFLSNVPLNRKVIAASVVVWMLLALFSRPILVAVNSVLAFGGDYSVSYVGSRTLVYLLGLGCIWIFALSRYRYVEEGKLDEYKFQVIMLMVGLMCGALSMANSNAFRAAYYYIIVVVGLLPAAIGTYKKGSRFLMTYDMTAACILFIVTVQPLVLGTSSYHFFWNQ